MDLTRREKEFILARFACVYCDCDIAIEHLRGMLTGDVERDRHILRMIDHYSNYISFVLELAAKFTEPKEDKQ